MKEYQISKLQEFLDLSPTAWHSVENISKELINKNFIELKENSSWKLESGKRYFVIREGGSICAFINSKRTPKCSRILASHLDSPALKLKPNAEIRKNNALLFGVEIYGAPLLSSWLNRDLGIAGRIAIEKTNGKFQSHLVNVTNYPLTIPQLAIHLDREVNEKGLILNKQEHLNALATISDKFSKNSYLEYILKEQIPFKKLLGYDLFLYPLEKSRLLGYKNEMISAYRIDSLASVHAALEALLQHEKSKEDELKIITFLNHEEVGSLSSSGASSPFISQTIERILISHKSDREDYFRHLSESFCVSIDLAHAWHPNYGDKHDPLHQPLLGMGPVIKNNAQQKYASDALSAFPVRKAAHKVQIALQEFVSRNEIPSGTTIGPIHASQTGIPTVDIGCAQLSMHSARELMSTTDQKAMYKLLVEILR